MQKPSQTAFSTSVIFLKSKPRAFRRSVIPWANAWNFAFRPSQIAVTLLRKSSLVFQRCTKAATRTAITATTAPIGLVSAAKAFLSTPPNPPTFFITFATEAKPFMAEPTVDTVLPSTTRSGPIAAARAATFRMVFFCASLMLFSLSTNACTLETTARMAGISSSPKEMASSSSWDFRMVSCPFRLSCMVLAMSSATPSQFSMAEDSLSISSGAAFIRARKPDMAFLPTSDSAAAAASDSDRPEKAVRQSARISDRSLMEPSALVVAMVTSPMALPEIFTSPARLFMMVRRAVPAWLPLIPAFAIRPIASAVSSAEKPRAPAIGAQYLKVSPIMETFVLALELAAARMSAK